MQDFSKNPFLVIWEVTQACDLACRHCRAGARPDRDPGELTTAEGLRLLSQIREMGDPLLVFTGGDPLKRGDLYELLRASVQMGLRTAITPSATPLLTEAAIERIAATGVARMAVSLDGPDAAAHDTFRGVAGSFDITLRALRHAARIGLETQVNTTVTKMSAPRLRDIARLVERERARLWSVFFLVVTGRAALADDLTAEEYEQVFEVLYEVGQGAPFAIKTTEAQHYRRYAAQRKKKEDRPAPPAVGPAGINDGKGFVFVSHTGEIFPSGFLDVTAGNVRQVHPAAVYREAPLFRVLREPDSFSGKCGACEYRNLCGGSRSRAYALSGDYLASDPRCVYVPAGWAA